jgi:hypothetical protein
MLVERCLACEADGKQGGGVRQTLAVSALCVATWFEGPLRGVTGLIHFTLNGANRLEARRTIAFAQPSASQARQRSTGRHPRAIHQQG